MSPRRAVCACGWPSCNGRTRDGVYRAVPPDRDRGPLFARVVFDDACPGPPVPDDGLSPLPGLGTDPDTCHAGDLAPGYCDDPWEYRPRVTTCDLPAPWHVARKPGAGLHSVARDYARRCASPYTPTRRHYKPPAVGGLEYRPSWVPEEAPPGAYLRATPLKRCPVPPDVATVWHSDPWGPVFVCSS